MSGKHGLEQHIDDEGTGIDLETVDRPAVQPGLPGVEAHAPGSPGSGDQAGDGSGTGTQIGRPKGSRNKSTAEMVRYLNTFGAGPLVGMAKIVNMVDERTGLPDFQAIAALTGMERAEAAKFWQTCADKLAPYMHQKLPMAIDVKTGADREILVINASATIDDPEIDRDDLLGGAFGGIIDDDVTDIEPDDESEQNQ